MSDPESALFLNGEPHTSRLILRDLVNAAIGFETLAAETAKPAKSLHRTLSKEAGRGAAHRVVAERIEHSEFLKTEGMMR